MDSKPSGQDGIRRRSILQGVYEENLGIERAESHLDAPAEDMASSSSPALRMIGGVLATCLSLAVVIFYLMPALAAPLSDGDASAVGADSLTNLATTAPLNLEVPREPPAGTSLPAMTSGSGVSLAHVFGLRVRTIVIDPGHGGKESGAVGPTGLTEKEVALDVAHRLRERLEQRGNYRILMTRERDEEVSLRDRVEFANDNNADLFVSLHVNSLPVESVTSIETYYFGTDTSERAMRAAEHENRHADFSVAEFNEMIQEIGNSMRVQESRRLAGSIQSNLYRNMSSVNDRIADWGVKTAPFVVLLGVEAPSVLSEMAVLSNPEEEELLRSRDHREKLAASLEEGIFDYLNEQPPPTASN